MKCDAAYKVGLTLTPESMYESFLAESSCANGFSVSRLLLGRWMCSKELDER